MHPNFELSGPQMELASYPRWTQQMVADCQSARDRVFNHPLWALMKTGHLDPVSTRNFMVGVWPVIERFPGYMAHNLLKTHFGRSPGDNMARKWLVRNIRVEQNHADYWLNWAEGAGVAADDVIHGVLPAGTQALADWCEEISANKDGDVALAAGLIATNYAVEGATGDWSQLIYESQAYADSLPVEGRKASLRWLQLHAAYDDAHPWEALEIVCTLVGDNPSSAVVAHLTHCVEKSYLTMAQTLDHCLPVAALQDVENTDVENTEAGMDFMDKKYA